MLTDSRNTRTRVAHPLRKCLQDIENRIANLPGCKEYFKLLLPSQIPLAEHTKSKEQQALRSVLLSSRDEVKEKLRASVPMACQLDFHSEQAACAHRLQKYCRSVRLYEHHCAAAERQHAA